MAGCHSPDGLFDPGIFRNLEKQNVDQGPASKARQVPRPISRRRSQHLPLGVSSNFRFWGEDETVFVKHGKGARLWDLDGNEYIDYRLGYGPAILGHCHPEVDAAAREGQNVGTGLRARHREGSHRRQAHQGDDAGGRPGPLLQFRHRSGDGGRSASPALYRQGQLRHLRRLLSRPLRRHDVDRRSRGHEGTRARTRRSSPMARASRSWCATCSTRSPTTMRSAWKTC